MASKAVTKKESTAVADAVPDYLKSHAGDGLDENTKGLTVLPRVKLLHAISPEVMEGDMKAGEFFHTVAEESMGDELLMVPLYVYQTVTLFRPRKDAGGGILARSFDAVNWDKPNEEFNVKLDNGKKVTWNTGDNVIKSGLVDFGSSDPEDPDSPPAASRNINIVAYFPEHPDLSPAIINLSKGSMAVGKKFVSKLSIARAPCWGTQFNMGVTKSQNQNNETFLNYKFEGAGFVMDEGEAMSYKEMSEYFKERQSGIVYEDDDNTDHTDDQDKSGGNF